MKTKIIKEHSITLHKVLSEYTITLRPLNDDHLPLLHKWNTDPEVLYWSEGPNADPLSNDENAVQSIYKETSNAGYCFIIEVNGIAIGECLLCEMTLQYVVDQYPASTDIKRIDILIGEKSYWNMGIGSIVVKMLVSLAFGNNNTDIIYGITGDYNKRSGRIFQKNGFNLFQKYPASNLSKDDGQELHYRLTREEYQNPNRG